MLLKNFLVCTSKAKATQKYVSHHCPKILQNSEMTSRLLWEDILETDQEEASDWDDNDGEHMGIQVKTFFFPNEE